MGIYTILTTSNLVLRQQLQRTLSTANVIVQSAHHHDHSNHLPYKAKAKAAAPTTPAKLPTFLIPSLFELVAGVEVEPAPVPEVEAIVLPVTVPLGSVVAVATMLVIFVPSPIASDELAIKGTVSFMYVAQVAFMATGQVGSEQMAWSWGPWAGTTVVGGEQR